MTREEAIKVLEMFLHKQCDLGRTEFAYDANTVWDAVHMARNALYKQKPYEKFESVKDHIKKLAGDYKCWDNRLTDDEAVELCRILEKEPVYFPPCVDCNTKMNEIREAYDKLKNQSGLRWIERFDNEDKWLECPHCHTDSTEAYNYCPNCGADMRESEGKE